MNKDLVGDINHNVQPVIGWLRLCIADGKSLSTAQMVAAVDKLYLALAAAQEIE